MIEGYYGEVVDNKDPKKIGRLRVKVFGFYDEIPNDMIPWAIPSNTAFNRLDPPPVGSQVQIDFIEGEILAPVWFTYNGLSATDMEIPEEDYTKSAVLLYKKLDQYEGEGIVKLLYVDSIGLILELKKGGKVSKIELRKDNTVYLQNSQYGKVVHISNESISLGTETKSAEPGVMGDKNFDAHNNINDAMKEFSGIVEVFAQQVVAVSSSSSVLAPLIAPAMKLKAECASKISAAAYNKNKNQYPETKSKIVTTD